MLPQTHYAKNGSVSVAYQVLDGAHGRRYAVTYTTDSVDGFSAGQVAELTRISQRLSVLCDSSCSAR